MQDGILYRNMYWNRVAFHAEELAAASLSKQ